MSDGTPPLEPICRPERPGIGAFLLRPADRAPVIIVIPNHLRDLDVPALAADLLTIDPAQVRCRAGLDKEPDAWLSELLTGEDKQPMAWHTRPLQNATESASDADLAWAALQQCQPRLADGTPFDLELRPLGEDITFAHMSRRGGPYTTLALKAGDSLEKIVEYAELALTRPPDGDSSPGADSLDPKSAVRIGAVLAAMRDMSAGSQDGDPWRLTHGFNILLQSWRALPETVRDGTVKPEVGEDPELEETSAPPGQSVPPGGPLDLSRPRIVATGLDVVRALIDVEPDLAGWAAEQTALIAEELGSNTDTAEAWRLAGWAAEACFDPHGITRCTGAALRALRRGGVDDETRRRVLRSVVTSRLSMDIYLDGLSNDAWHEATGRAAKRAATLAALLDEAQSGEPVTAPDDGHRAFIAASDAVLRVRIAALRGDLEAAVVGVKTAHALSMARHPGIGSLLYNDQLIIRQRRVSLGLDPPEYVTGALDAAFAFWDGLPDKGESRARERTIFLRNAALCYLDLGQLEPSQSAEAARLAVMAWRELARLLDRRIRPLPAAAERDLVDALAFADVAQLALLRYASKPTDDGASEDLAKIGGPPALVAAEIADRSKSRQLRQALGFSAADLRELIPDVPGPLRSALEDSQSNIIDPGQDPRGILANLETAARLSGQDAGRLVQHYLSTPNGTSLAGQLPPGIAALDLFAGRDETFVYLYHDGALMPATLPMPAARLAGAASRLKSAFNGNPLLPAIDSASPAARDGMLVSARACAEALAALVLPRVTSAELLVVALHGAWFDLPVESWLGAMAERSGHTLDVVATPGIGAGFAMAGRRRLAQDSGYMGLLVSPAAEDRAAGLFQQARETLKESLRTVVSATHSKLLVVRDGQGDFETFRRIVGGCDLVHILAHGDDRSMADPLRSGLLLADGGEARSLAAGANLHASDVLARPVGARHVTLQACSLGRLRTAPDGELWGLARAFLSSGANTVTAPLWDVDIRSSTALFADTYRRWAEQPEVSLQQAFCAAQRAMAARPADDPWSHVYHWGAFRLIGGFFPDPNSPVTDEEGDAYGEP